MGYLQTLAGDYDDKYKFLQDPIPKGATGRPDVPPHNYDVVYAKKDYFILEWDAVYVRNPKGRLHTANLFD